MKNLLYETKEKVGIISLNRPDRRNALSRELLEDMVELLGEITREKDVHVIVIKGMGKIFSSGHDLSEIRDAEAVQIRDLMQTCLLAMRAIREAPQPVIAQVHGIATAAGCQLVAACDLAIAAEDALFGTPGVKIGLFCSTPAVFLSRNVGRKKALEMLLTGEFLPAREALLHGLVNKVVPASELDDATFTMASNIATLSFSAIAIGKREFYQQLQLEDFQAFSYASEVITVNSTTKDAHEGIGAFLEKRAPKWIDGW